MKPKTATSASHDSLDPKLKNPASNTLKPDLNESQDGPLDDASETLHEELDLSTEFSTALDSSRASEQEADEALASYERFKLLQELADQINRKTLSLPPCPETAMRVKHRVDLDNTDTSALADIIYTEPLLVARVLQYSNSAINRPADGKVKNLQTAITRIGTKSVRALAIAMAMEQAFAIHDSKQREIAYRIRSESVLTSLFGLLLAQASRYKGVADEAMFAGLIHGIGKFYLLTRADEFPALFKCEIAVGELMESWHPTIGATIAEYWDLSANIIHAIDNQNQPAETSCEKATLCTLLNLAITAATGFLDNDSPEEFLRGLHTSNEFKILGIGEQAFEHVIVHALDVAPSLLNASNG